jgi:hypothetical protein
MDAHDQALELEFAAELWLWDGPAAWHFVTVPPDGAAAIRAVREPVVRGFGSVRVIATIGQTRWATSVFPQSSDGTYVLPVKKQVRIAEAISEGDVVQVRIEVVS